MGNVANVIVLPVTNVANFQFILSQRLNRDRFSFPNLVNPVNPVKKTETLSLRASVLENENSIWLYKFKFKDRGREKRYR